MRLVLDVQQQAHKQHKGCTQTPTLATCVCSSQACTYTDIAANGTTLSTLVFATVRADHLAVTSGFATVWYAYVHKCTRKHALYTTSCSTL
jgi:hypothetical protein